MMINQKIQEKSCGCIIIEDNNVLLIKHKIGHWDFPKGHVEGKETEVETAKREVKEETNLDVEIQEDKKYTIEYLTDKGNMKQVIYFIAKKIAGEIIPQESEVSDIRWVNFEEAEEIITYDSSKNLWKNVLKDIQNNLGTFHK